MIHARWSAMLLSAGLWATPLAAESTVPALIDDLRNDDILRNASDAITRLDHVPEPPTSALQRALDSSDYQQRQLACLVLWRQMSPQGRDRNGAATPEWRRSAQGGVTRRLLEVTFEGLRDDGLPLEQAGGFAFATPCNNACNGFYRLREHAADAKDLLEAGLVSPDHQQRFLCALALGCSGTRASVAESAPILIAHLREHRMKEDAKWSAHALFCLGSAALPYLEAALPEADAQQRMLIELIKRCIVAPPVPGGDRSSRPAVRLNDADFDPSVEPPLVREMAWLEELRR